MTIKYDTDKLKEEAKIRGIAFLKFIFGLLFLVLCIPLMFRLYIWMI